MQSSHSIPSRYTHKVGQTARQSILPKASLSRTYFRHASISCRLGTSALLFPSHRRSIDTSRSSPTVLAIIRNRRDLGSEGFQTNYVTSRTRCHQGRHGPATEQGGSGQAWIWDRRSHSAGSVVEGSSGDQSRHGFSKGESRSDLPSDTMYRTEPRTAIGLRFQYPLSARTLSPPTDPLYYTRLVQGVERAGQGKARNWWKVFFQTKGQA